MTVPPEARGGWVSADSHVVEPPHLFTDRLPAPWRAQAPHVAPDPTHGDVYVIPGIPYAVPLGFAHPPAARGATSGPAASLSDLRPGGADPTARLLDQDIDGVRAEVLYPTVGLVLLRQPDAALRTACVDAYNGWLLELCAVAPERLLAVAVLAAADPARAAAEVEAAAAAGAASVLLSSRPDGPDLDDAAWAPLFDAVTGTGLPLAFHALGGPHRPGRGSALATLATQPHEAQSLLATLVLGGVLDAWPALQIVLAEHDASWVPHLTGRMDRLVQVHGAWGGGRGPRLPSEAVADQVHFAIPNDPLALVIEPPLPADRLMWGSDYPHGETTWPHSAERLRAATDGVDPARLRAFTVGTAARLYGLDP